jgi:hypothetical protein
MQTPAYLWLELQVAQQCLRENFAQSQVHTKAETLDSSSRVGTRCRMSVKPLQALPPRSPILRQRLSK